MAITIHTIDSTGPASGVNVASLVSANPARMTFTLLNDSDPGSAPSDIATIHLSESVTTTPGVFLTAGAPRITVTADPATLWVSVHGEGDFVQVVTD
jgi:hypothetical protein